MPTRKPLTPKQERFVAEYLIDLNATQAAIRAGYSTKTAENIGWQNLRKPEIAAAVAAAKSLQLERANLSAERVLEELRRIGFADLGTLFDDDEAGARRRGLFVEPVIPRTMVDVVSGPIEPVIPLGIVR